MSAVQQPSLPSPSPHVPVALQLRPAETAGDLAAVRNLMRAYQLSLPIDLDFQHFEAELQTLPGDYAPSSGRLVLAWMDGAAVGCIALRALTPSRCEMKRLFVRPEARSSGAGRALAEHIVSEAAVIGYDEIVLDTLPVLTAALRLYERMGFRPTAPYCPNPAPGARWLALDLTAGRSLSWPS